jgi:hypothetical protein
MQVHNCGYVYAPEVGEPKFGIASGTKFKVESRDTARSRRWPQKVLILPFFAYQRRILRSGV